MEQLNLDSKSLTNQLQDTIKLLHQKYAFVESPEHLPHGRNEHR